MTWIFLLNCFSCAKLSKMSIQVWHPQAITIRIIPSITEETFRQALPSTSNTVRFLFHHHFLVALFDFYWPIILQSKQGPNRQVSPIQTSLILRGLNILLDLVIPQWSHKLCKAHRPFSKVVMHLRRSALLLASLKITALNCKWAAPPRLMDLTARKLTRLKESLKTTTLCLSNWN